MAFHEHVSEGQPLAPDMRGDPRPADAAALRQELAPQLLALEQTLSTEDLCWAVTSILHAMQIEASVLALYTEELAALRQQKAELEGIMRVLREKTEGLFGQYRRRDEFRAAENQMTNVAPLIDVAHQDIVSWKLEHPELKELRRVLHWAADLLHAVVGERLPVAEQFYLKQLAQLYAQIGRMQKDTAD